MTGKLRDGLVAGRGPNRSGSVCDLSSGAEARPGLAAGKEGRRPGLDGAAPLSGLPSEQEVAPHDLGQGQILTSVFLYARQSVGWAAEHSDGAVAQRDGGNGRRCLAISDRSGRIVDRSSLRMSPRADQDLSDLRNIRMIRSRPSKYPRASGSSCRSKALRREKWLDSGLLCMSSKQKKLS